MKKVISLVALWIVLLVVTLCLLATTPAHAAHQYLEKQYQTQWCLSIGGVTEFVLDDKTRVDCLTAEYAIEVEFAPKKFEAIGQTLFYAIQTNRKPGILLIMEQKADQRHLDRLTVVASRYGIKIWVIRPEDIKKGKR